jgi:hypothetical protein
VQVLASRFKGTMNKRQRKKASEWKYLPLTISLSEFEASKMDREELYKMMRKKWEDSWKRLLIEAEHLVYNDGSNKNGK